MLVVVDEVVAMADPVVLSEVEVVVTVAEDDVTRPDTAGVGGFLNG